MYEVILSLILSKSDFNLIDKEPVFKVGEIRLGWQYDEYKKVFYRYKKEDKQKTCLSGFR